MDVLQIGIGTRRKQKACDINRTIQGRYMERRVARLILVIDVCAFT